jgi:hypothetical protein
MFACLPVFMMPYHHEVAVPCSQMWGDNTGASPSTAGVPFCRGHGFCWNSCAKHHASVHSFRDQQFRALGGLRFGNAAMVLNCSGCPAQYSTFFVMPVEPT